MGKIFISYRREDSADATGRIYDRLREKFGDNSVFTDVDSIPIGVDFREHLAQEVGKCDVLLAVIGRRWINIEDDSGRRRLDLPTDFVRTEIETALDRDIPVVPLLAHGITMPMIADDLPESIKPLEFRNARTVRADPDFHKDMDRLISGLEEIFSGLEEKSANAQQTLSKPVEDSLLTSTTNIDEPLDLSPLQREPKIEIGLNNEKHTQAETKVLKNSHPHDVNFITFPAHKPVQKMARGMYRSLLKLSPQQVKKLRSWCETLQIEYDSLDLNDSTVFDYRWVSINVLLDSIEEWKQDESGRLRRFMSSHQDELSRLTGQRDELNSEYFELRAGHRDNHVKIIAEQYFGKNIATLFRDVVVFISKAISASEYFESSRRRRISQLGFEVDSPGFEAGSVDIERLSSRQIVSVLLGILFITLSLSTVQKLVNPYYYRGLHNDLFISFQTTFTYGAALLIALAFILGAGTGYNGLTRQRSKSAYLSVGAFSILSWLVVSYGFPYLYDMFFWADLNEDSIDRALNRALINIQWSYPYALQSVVFAVSLFWILDFHQSRGMTWKLTLQQRFVDVAVIVFVLGIGSAIAFSWTEGIGLFEGFATKDVRFTGHASMGWFVANNTAVGAVVALLVPKWVYNSRSKSPDQIIGRLIVMNKRRLSEEVRKLNPDELINVIAAISASIAAVDDRPSHYKKVAYQIICCHLASLPNSDVDIDSIDTEFDHYLELYGRDELQLEEKLHNFNALPLLASLLPFVASSVALADGVFLDQERDIVKLIEKHTSLTE